MAKSLTPRRKTIHLAVSDVCNNSCVFCLNSRVNGRIANLPVKNPDLEKIKEALKEGINLHGIKEVQFTIAEPTVSRFLTDAISFAKSIGYELVSINTNGRLLFRNRLAEKLFEAGLDQIILSIHGHNSEIHDYLVGRKGAFNDVLRGLKLLKELRTKFSFKLNFLTVLNRKNIDFLKEMYEFFLRFSNPRNGEILSFTCLKMLGRGKRIFDEIGLKYDFIAKKFLTFWRENGMPDGVILSEIPPCVLVSNTSEGEILPFMDIPDVRFVKEWMFLKKDPNYVKSDFCKKCVLTPVCPGVLRNYIKKFGWNEFSPVLNIPSVKGKDQKREKEETLSVEKNDVLEKFVFKLFGVKESIKEKYDVSVLKLVYAPDSVSFVFSHRVKDSENVVQVNIQRLKKGVKYFFKTPYLGVSYSERKGKITPLLMVLLKKLKQRIAKFTFENIEKALLKLPSDLLVNFDGGKGEEKSGSENRIEEHGKVNDVKGVHEEWGTKRFWYNFFAISEIKRGRDSLITVDVPAIFVEHGEFECQFVGLGDFVFFPWNQRKENRKSSSRIGRLKEESLSVFEDKKNNGENEKRSGGFYTDLEDMDVIDGGGEKLSVLLEEIKNNASPELVYINTTCLPEMIGDDFEFLIEEIKKDADFPIISKGQEGEYNPYGHHVEAFKEEILKHKSVFKIKNSVNLIGFIKGRDLLELMELLDWSGIRVNEVLYPELSPKKAKRYLQAELFVMYPLKEWEEVYDYILDGINIKKIFPPPPYGIAKTEKWIKDILKEFGTDKMADSVLKSIEKARKVYDDFQSQHRDVHAGFILYPDIVSEFLTDSLFFGIPVVPFLVEAGITPYLAIYDNGKISKGFYEELIRKSFPTAKIFWFKSEEELSEFLSIKYVPIVYSDYFYDYRIYDHGKVPFSTSIFEKGFQGAVRTLNRIRALLKLDFYSKYNRFLKG